MNVTSLHQALGQATLSFPLVSFRGDKNETNFLPLQSVCPSIYSLSEGLPSTKSLRIFFFLGF